MAWLHNPRFAATRDRVLRAFSKREYSFRKIRPVIFLCGGRHSQRREALAQYILRLEEFHLFYAEDVWSVLSKYEGQNALKMEAELAQLADMVCVIVESEGTLAELGAFALQDDLRKKLLPVVDIQYRSDQSFVNTGPLRWIEDDSMFAPTIWIDLDVILRAANEFQNRLGRLPQVTGHRIENLAENQKHLLFLLCDLIAVFGPSTIDELEFYVSRIALGACEPVTKLVGLARALRLIDEVEIEGRVRYLRKMKDNRPTSYQVLQYLFLPGLRAEVLSALQGIPEANEALKRVSQCP